MSRLGSKNIKWDSRELQRLYWDKKMSCYAIALKYHTVGDAVLKALQKFGINRRKRCEFGRKHSKETRNKLRLAQLGRHHSNETRAKMSRSQKGRIISEQHRMNLSKAFKGRIFSEQHLTNIMLASHKRPNKTELYLQDILDKYYPDTWKYVGDGQLIIGGKCPDYTNINGQKALIELYGGHWHKPEDEEPRIEHFKKYGYNCIIIWEDELKAIEKVVVKINCFMMRVKI